MLHSKRSRKQSSLISGPATRAFSHPPPLELNGHIFLLEFYFSGLKKVLFFSGMATLRGVSACQKEKRFF